MDDIGYRAEGRRVLLGLLGAPISHSASPSMHEAAAHALGLRAHYQLVEVAGADENALRRLLVSMREIGFAGTNVTFPYKEAVIGLVDELSPEARSIGAINTIVFRDGRLLGSNTDASGFSRIIRPYLADAGPGPIALIGAGGVGRAIFHALQGLSPPEIRLFDHDGARMEALAKDTDAICASSIEEALSGAVGVINATPVGMLPDQRSPVPAELLHSGMFVSDAVYSPLWTPLLLAAKLAGARTMTGKALAIAQAIDAFELFTGLVADEHVMERAFDEVMLQRVH